MVQVGVELCFEEQAEFGQMEVRNENWEEDTHDPVVRTGADSFREMLNKQKFHVSELWEEGCICNFLEHKHLKDTLALCTRSQHVIRWRGGKLRIKGGFQDCWS